MQEPKRHVKRQRQSSFSPPFTSSSSSSSSNSASSVTSDPLFRMQWHLNKGARGGFDMNVQPAWNKGCVYKTAKNDFSFFVGKLKNMERKIFKKLDKCPAPFQKSFAGDPRTFGYRNNQLEQGQSKVCSWFCQVSSSNLAPGRKDASSQDCIAGTLHKPSESSSSSVKNCDD